MGLNSVAIDGPSGAGKSTLARRAAQAVRQALEQLTEEDD